MGYDVLVLRGCQPSWDVRVHLLIPIILPLLLVWTSLFSSLYISLVLWVLIINKEVCPRFKKWELPATSFGHSVFHVSHLKKAVSDHAKVNQLIPYMNENNEWLTILKEVFGYRKNPATREWEVLISWKGLPPQHEATWKDCMTSSNNFQTFTLKTRWFWRRNVMLDPNCI